jgi:hypothetical protein
VLLSGSRFSVTSIRGLSVFGFGCPLVIGIMLYALFDPALAGGYNFELRLPTGLESIPGSTYT